MRQLRIPVSSTGELNTDSGSVMHGIIMDLLPEPWPDKLHQDGRQPFSQWLETDDRHEPVWHINILDDELAELMTGLIRDRDKLYCKHFHTDIIIKELEIKEQSLHEYLTSFIMKENVPERYRIFFRTPTAHKSQGEYTILPTINMIAGNLQKRFEQMDPECLIADPEIGQQITDNNKLIRYKLESRPFNLEGTKVFGYTGFMDIRFQGEDMLRKLSAALFSIAEWTGIGIKTALGMGGCRIINLDKREG